MHRIASCRAVALTVATAAAIGLLATACGSSADEPAAPSDTSADGGGTGAALTGSWTLTAYTTDGVSTPAAAQPANLTIVGDGTFSGSTGCNRVSGTWEGDAEGPFTITAGPMTQMACVDPAGQAQEAAVVAGFPEVTDATVSGATLTFLDDAGGALFTWTAGPDGVEGAWAVTGVNDGNDAVVASAATEAASITFAADGTVSGSTGCNSFSGTYEIDGSGLAVSSEVATTMMACEGEAQELEEQFTAALAAVATWERSGDQVTLRDAAGATQLTLTAS